MSGTFSFYYRFHLFNYLGIRIAFFLTRATHSLFYQIRNTAVLIDSLLSSLIYLSIVSSFFILLTSHRHNLAMMLTLLAFNILSLWLLREERKERLCNTLKPFSIYDINIGSAKILKGNISILHLFVNGQKRQWNKEQIAQVLKGMAHAALWIAKQAKQFKVDVLIKNKDLSNTRIRFLKAIPEYSNHYKNMDEFHGLIKSSLGNANLSEFSSETGKDQQICLFVHVLKWIRSFAVPDYLGAKQEGKSLEYCVIAYGSPPSAYAHELLHLFGANDYYCEYPKTIQSLKSSFLTKSVMFSAGQLPLENLLIDELTAQNIGWL